MGRPKKQKTEELPNDEKVIQMEVRTRELRYDFNAIETHTMSERIANVTLDINRQKDLKKADAKIHDGIIKPLEVERDDLARKISDGWEYRSIDCEVTYNSPVPGKKTVKRVDDGKTWVEEMTADEYNLFTQPVGQYEDIDHEEMDGEDMPDEGADGEGQPLIEGPKESEEDTIFPENL